MLRPKVINDAIHGTYKIDGVRRELLSTPEFNKLCHIKQLGLAHLIFPGAHHTRFEHSLGVSHIAGLMADSIKLDSTEKELVQVAGMLHDVGHGPYSHTLEHILHERGGMDHMSITEGIIRGEYDVLKKGEEKIFSERLSVPEILEKHGIDPNEIANLIRGPDAGGTERSIFDFEAGNSEFTSKDITLANIVHGPVDCDQMDYLLRDSHFTGVKHGVIDHHRLINSLRRYSGDVAIDEGGLSALEGMLTARALMYSAVYFHRVTRITEIMLSRAVEYMDTSSMDLQRMVDSEIWEVLGNGGEYQKDILSRIKYRQLFKVAAVWRKEELDENNISRLIELASNSNYRREVEKRLAERSGLTEGHVAIDVPSVKLLLSEPRMAQVDIRVLGDDNQVRWFKEHTTLADALRNRQVSQAACYIMTTPGNEEVVSSIAKRVIFS